jgi:hypothetical protein
VGVAGFDGRIVRRFKGRGEALRALSAAAERRPDDPNVSDEERRAVRRLVQRFDRQ